VRFYSQVGCSLFLVLAFGVNAGAAPMQNPDNGHWYEYIETPGTWTAAKAAAESMTFMGVQGHLVDILDADENAFVQSLATNDLRAWIGLTDEASEGDFVWITGEPLSYTNWSSGEPNDSDGNEDYVEIFASGAWNDAPNSHSLNQGYVVEFDVNVVPEPASFAIWSLLSLGSAGIGCYGRRRKSRRPS